MRSPQFAVGAGAVALIGGVGRGSSDTRVDDGEEADAGDAGGAPTLPSPLHGVTVDDISKLSSIVASLGALPYFREDMVPDTQPLFGVLASSF